MWKILSAFGRSPQVMTGLSVVLAVLSFGLNIERGRALQLDSTVPRWVAEAIPPALSRILFDHDKRYTSLVEVHDAFYQGAYTPPLTAAGIDAAIAAVAALDPKQIDRRYALLGPDDKGIVDLVEGGFRLFGLRTDSAFKTYFLVLGLSCLAFLLQYGSRPAPLLALVAFLVMHYQVMPALVMNEQVGSPLALRAIPILSMVACLHCLLFGWYGRIN